MRTTYNLLSGKLTKRLGKAIIFILIKNPGISSMSHASSHMVGPI